MRQKNLKKLGGRLSEKIARMNLEEGGSHPKSGKVKFDLKGEVENSEPDDVLGPTVVELQGKIDRHFEDL